MDPTSRPSFRQSATALGGHHDTVPETKRAATGETGSGSQSHALRLSGRHRLARSRQVREKLYVGSAIFDFLKRRRKLPHEQRERYRSQNESKGGAPMVWTVGIARSGCSASFDVLPRWRQSQYPISCSDLISEIQAYVFQ